MRIVVGHAAAFLAVLAAEALGHVRVGEDHAQDGAAVVQVLEGVQIAEPDGLLQRQVPSLRPSALAPTQDVVFPLDDGAQQVGAVGEMLVKQRLRHARRGRHGLETAVGDPALADEDGRRVEQLAAPRLAVHPGARPGHQSTAPVTFLAFRSSISAGVRPSRSFSSVSLCSPRRGGGRSARRTHSEKRQGKPL